MKRHLFASLSLALATSVAIPSAQASHHRSQPPPKKKAAFRQAMVKPRPKITPTLNLAGQVLLPDGLPAAGATVYLIWMTETNSVQFTKVPVDGSGAFKQPVKLTSAPRGCNVGVSAFVPGKGWAWFQSMHGAKEFADLKMRLQPGVTLTGRLLHSDGSPVANAELHAEALFPQGMGLNGQAGGLQQAVFNRQFGVTLLQMTPYDYLMRLLPEEAMQPLFRVKTDAGGRFTLEGLPRQSSLLLRPGSGLTLTPNSMAPILVQTGERQEAGTLIAMRTGSARIRVLDAETHRPAPNVMVNLMQTNGGISAPIYYHGQPPFNANANLVTDGNGLLEVKNLVPGTYQVNVSGRVQKLEVPEGQAAPQIDFTLRQGQLNGRLLDANGKPLANVDIMMNAANGAAPGSDFAPQFSTRNAVFFGNVDGRFNNFGFAAGWERRPVARTGSDGTFVLPQFPWGSDRVIVRATRGNDRAEYLGRIDGIGKTLELRMKANALVSVSGRLVDPQRRPVADMTCQALHWQSSPRPTWFASAHPVHSDAQGRFRVDGLERGESFSIISSGRQVMIQQQAAMQRPMVRTVAAVKKSPVNDFESPRFVASKDDSAQDLGDMMIHPSSAQDEVLQSYGAGQREIASAGVTEAPSAPTVEQAKAALKRYQQALQSGDVKAVQALTSRLSPGYSANLPEFLLRAGLSGSAANEANRHEEARVALQFVPRALIRALTGRNAALAGGVGNAVINDFEVTDLVASNAVPDDGFRTASLQGADGETAADDAPDAGKEWVILMANRDGNMVMAGALHLEAGQWRVVAHPFTMSMPLSSLLGFFAGGQTAAATDLTKKANALPLEQFAAAREAGERYLHAWAQNHPEAMLALTSNYAFSFSKDVAQFKKTQEHRADEGLCPLASESKVALQPVPDLTLWDQKWLINQARTRGLTSQMFNGNGMVNEAMTDSSTFSDRFLDKGRLALLQYSTPNGRFLMLMVRPSEKWEVVEPALPL